MRKYINFRATCEDLKQTDQEKMGQKLSELEENERDANSSEEKESNRYTDKLYC